MNNKRRRFVSVIKLCGYELPTHRNDEPCFALAPPSASPDIGPGPAYATVESVTTDYSQLLTSLVTDENN
ncbi:unnamed protein product [Parnassius apollo]|uniref:(apollo) hypothetical protein n=1 Tax=Parnassius apollo TaxID=110799 RepID=A0A8S3W0W4_PARAO|nr:unnamed protein product [Parnassius apollo]